PRCTSTLPTTSAPQPSPPVRLPPPTIFHPDTCTRYSKTPASRCLRGSGSDVWSAAEPTCSTPRSLTAPSRASGSVGGSPAPGISAAHLKKVLGCRQAICVPSMLVPPPTLTEVC